MLSVNGPPELFWSIADSFPELVSQLHVPSGTFDLNARVLWLSDTEGTLYFLLECRAFRDDFESLWSNFRQEMILT